MTSLGLALTMLRHQKGRTVLYVTGVLGAALLLFFQFGFLGSLSTTATQFTDALDFDLAVVSKDYLYFNYPGSIPRERLAEAAGHPAVEDAVPLQLGTLRWPTGGEAVSASDYILVLATDPSRIERLFRARGSSGRPIFAGGDSASAAGLLAVRGNVLLDRNSRPEYGAVPRSEAEGRWAKVLGPSENTEQVHVVGGFDVGTGFATNAVLLASIDTLDEIERIDDRAGPRLTVNLGLLQIARSADPATVRAELTERLPGDVHVFTRAELDRHERTHWTTMVPVGKFFWVGVWVAIIVGLLFIYQMMDGDIRKHEAQYATLKALGYSNAYLAGVVLWQGLVLGLLGFVPSVGVAAALFALIRSVAPIALFVTPGLAFWVFVPTIGICLLSGLFALRKVYRAAPADLF